MTDRNRVLFTDTELEEFVRGTVTEVPGLLTQHPETAELGSELEDLDLLTALQTKFTVAIVGQMKAGKSTLLNALVGHDLAPTGVVETTATINRFTYGRGADCDTFSVHWRNKKRGKEGTSEEPLDVLDKWIGNRDGIDEAEFLEFRADAEFLKDIFLIDTPGTRSRLKQHESTIQGFLSGKLDEQTIRYGNRASAVLYVINPNAKPEDHELLQFFGSDSRLPGSTPYNSVAILHKWDTLQIGNTLEELSRLREVSKGTAWERFIPDDLTDPLKPDPLALAQLRREVLAESLAGKVSDVVIASGLLANCLRDVPEDVWPGLAKLAAESPPEVVANLLMHPASFLRDSPKASLDAVTRKRLLDSLDGKWHLLKFSVHLAYARGIDDGAKLRQTIEDACGIEKLRVVLQNRFIAYRRLIKALSILQKVQARTETASISLGNLAAGLVLGQEALDILRRPEFNTNPDLRKVRGYVETSAQTTQKGVVQIQSLHNTLVSITEAARRNAGQLQDDMDFQEKLSELDGSLIEENDRLLARCLLGADGPAVWTRLQLDSQEELHERGHEVAESQLEHWRKFRIRAYGDSRPLCDHLIERLNEILDYLEESSRSN